MNRYDQLEHLAYVLGRERRDVQNLLRAAALDPKMRDTVEAFLRTRVLRGGGDPDDPASFPLVTELPPGLMRIGRVVNGRRDGPVLALAEGSSDDIQHVGVFGRTRWGKSYLMRHMARQYIEAGGKCWIIDPEDEFSPLVAAIKEPQRPMAICAKHLRINFFEPPRDSVSPKTWLADISLLLRQEVYLRDGSLNLFTTTMLGLMKSKGIFSGGNQYPSLAETLLRFRNMKLGSSQTRGATWLESLINRLTMLYEAFEDTARVVHSHMLEQLTNRSAIFRLLDLRGIPLQFLADFLMVWLSRYNEGQHQ